VNLSDAKLLLIRAQNDEQNAYAQLARALGTNTVARNVALGRHGCQAAAPTPVAEPGTGDGLSHGTS